MKVVIYVSGAMDPDSQDAMQTVHEKIANHLAQTFEVKETGHGSELNEDTTLVRLRHDYRLSPKSKRRRK